MLVTYNKYIGIHLDDGLHDLCAVIVLLYDFL